MRKRLVFRLITLLLISLLFSASIMIVSVLACRKPHKPKDWDWKDWEDWDWGCDWEDYDYDDCDGDGWHWRPHWLVIRSLKRLSCVISRLPKEAFNNPKNATEQKEALRSMICNVTELIEDGKYQHALDMLKEIENRIREWIRHCWQTYLIRKVRSIVWFIEWILCRDCKPPLIVTVLRYPETPNYDEPVTVIAQVIDRKREIESVILSYQVNSASWINVTMNLHYGLYLAEIPPQPYDTTVSYKVYAHDKADNLAISETYSYVVIDSYPPIISHVEHVPTSPNHNEAVTVFANVTEPREASGVKNVNLFYKTNGDWQLLEMTMPNGLWTATIPGQSADVNVKFYIEAYDNVGNSAKTLTCSYTVKARPNLSPVAKFSESAESVLTGEVIRFNASDSYDPDGYIESYFWDFGDGTTIAVTSAFVDHVYADDGVYTVILTVTDNDGLTATATSTKTVSNRPPVASFAENATTVLTSEVIRFDASSSEDSDGSIIAYLWDLGDGTTAVGVEVNHAYEDDGVYTVTLTVIDDDGAIASTSSVKTVSNRPPVAYFIENATMVKEGEGIHFDASGSNDPDGYVVSYLWDFGDGTNATDMIVDHAYAEEGNYTVVLTVTDDDGASSSMSEMKTVEALAVAAAGWPLALLAAIALGIAALTATLLYGLYRRRKKKRGTASNLGSRPLVTVYVPAKFLTGYN